MGFGVVMGLVVEEDSGSAGGGLGLGVFVRGTIVF